MKNLKRALSLVLSAAMMVGMMAIGTSAAFADVDSSDNLEAISVMEMIGVMEGDGTNFNPDRVVTRNEMAVVICNLMNLKLNGFHNFTDVPEWADKYVAAMYTNGLTSGTSATTYGGAATVTTTEAALMVMKTLGYFEYQGEFEGDWKLATIKKATELDLFENIDAGVNDGLTRGEVAQLVLNALPLRVVNAHEQGGLNVSGDGFSVTEKASYTYATAYASLMQKLYDGKLVKMDGTQYDAFGRPAVKWTYTGNGKDESVTATKAPKLVITAAKNEKDMKALVKNYDLSAIAACIDGTNNTVVVETVAEYAALTGNGKTVEIYVDKYNDVTDVVVINEFCGKITKINKADEDTNTKRSVVVDYNTALSFETENFAKKDMVVYTKADGVVKSMKAADFVEGEIDAVVAGKNVKIDGVTYKFNANYDASALELGADVKIYLDSNGYLLFNGEVEAAAPTMNEFVVVTAKGADTFGAAQIKVLKTDGTTEVVGIEEKNGSLADVVKGTMYTMKDSDADGKAEFKAVETTDVNGDDKIAGFDAYASTTLNAKDDNLNNGWAIADDAVVFTVNAKGEYKVTTGAKLAAADSATVVAYADKASTGFYAAELIFATTEMSSSSDVVYGYVTADSSLVKNADDEQVYEVTFWNGEETVVALTVDTTVALAKGEFFGYKLNQDGEIADITKALTEGAIVAFDGAKVVFDGDATKYDVDDDTIIIYVDVEDKAGSEDGDIVIADKNEAETAYIANVKYVVDADKDVVVLFVDVQNDIANAL